MSSQRTAFYGTERASNYIGIKLERNVLRVSDSRSSAHLHLYEAEGGRVDKLSLELFQSLLSFKIESFSHSTCARLFLVSFFSFFLFFFAN